MNDLSKGFAHFLIRVMSVMMSTFISSHSAQLLVELGVSFL